MMELPVVKTVGENEWDRSLSFFPEHSFFFSPHWINTLRRVYMYNPLYFIASENRKISAMMPVMEVNSLLTGKRGVSLPFTDYCEPMVSDEKTFLSLIETVMAYGKRADWKYLEIRGGVKLLPGAVPYQTYLRHVLELRGGEEDLLRRLSSATRRNIRTATNSGIRVGISDLESDLLEYYRLHCITRKRHGVPPQPASFFYSIFENVISKKKGFVVLGRFEGKAIAGAVYFHSGKKGIYKFGASNLEYQQLRANNLVMWEAIRWFSRNGFEELCLGRTEPHNTGLARFKAGWGAQAREVTYCRYDFKRSSFITGGSEMNGFMERLFRALPPILLRAAGELLYKHVG